MTKCRLMLSALCLTALSALQAQAAVVLPAKAYIKPDEPIVVKFLNEKGDDGKKAIETLGTQAGQMDWLFSPAGAADIAGADGVAAFKLYDADGKEIKLGTIKPQADGSVDLSAACPELKDGGTWYLVWKDAPPLVIETLFNPPHTKQEYDKLKPQIDQLQGEQKTNMLGQYAPVVTHMELAEYAVITTDKGVIKAKFSYEAAPHTIDNFISLARQDFYDGSAFHRIISGFMIQGGDALANTPEAGMGGPGYDIMHEFSEKKHERGTLSMARSSSPDSAGSQFFIMHGKTESLDGKYSAFGDVFDGMNVVDALAKTPVSDGNGTVSGPKPKIESIRILPATAEIYGLKK